MSQCIHTSVRRMYFNANKETKLKVKEEGGNPRAKQKQSSWEKGLYRCSVVFSLTWLWPWPLLQREATAEVSCNNTAWAGRSPCGRLSVGGGTRRLTGEERGLAITSWALAEEIGSISPAEKTRHQHITIFIYINNWHMGGHSRC